MLAEAEESKLEINALKVLVLCRPEVEFAAATGRCRGRLYSIAMEIRVRLKVSVEVIEGYHNIIRVNTCRPPNMGLPLLSARCNIKKALGIGSKGSSKKLAAVSDSAHALLLECVEHTSDRLPTPSIALSDVPSLRWESPPATPLIPHTSKITDTLKYEVQRELLPSPAMAWAAYYSRRWHMACKPTDLRHAFAFVLYRKAAGYSEAALLDIRCLLCPRKIIPPA